MTDPETLFDEGAQRVLESQDLLARQRTSFDAILKGIWQISMAGLDTRTEKVQPEESYRHPHYVFVIDGKRGSGKTSLLLTLHHYLNHMGRGEHARLDDNTASYLKHAKFFGRQTGFQGTTLVLPVIFPNEMEDAETTMENIFAQVSAVLRPNDDEGQRRRERGRQDSEDLVKKLHSEVSVGWSFVRGQGVKTLERDSLDYRDFVKRRGEEAALSYTRLKSWRKFVHELLDHMQCTLLAICIDDTDLAPSVSEDILHAIRVYLSHPRIVTILCVDLRQLEHQLFLRRLSKLNSAVEALPPKDESTNEEWLRVERRELLHYLYKILPPGQRYNLNLAPTDIDKLFFKTQESHEFLVGRIRNDDGLVAPAAGGWNDFLASKVKDLWAKGRSRDAVAWWLFSKHAPRLFSALSVREVLYLLRQLRGGAVSIVDELERMALISPSLILLQDTVEAENIEKLDSLLDSYNLALLWDDLGGVSLKLSGEIFGRRDAVFCFLQWLIDLEAVRDGWRSERTRRHIGRWLRPQTGEHPLPNLHRELMTGSVGIASFISESVVPRNCLYLSDLIALGADIVGGISPDPRFQTDWGELFRASESRIGHSLRTRRLTRESGSREEKSNLGKDFLRQLAWRWTRLDPSASHFGADLSQLLWPVWRLVDKKMAFTADLFLDEVDKLASLFKSKKTQEMTRELLDFGAFLGQAMRWLLEYSLSQEASRRLLRMAFTVALDGGAPPGEGNLINLQRCLVELEDQNRRSWALLAWAAVPAVRKLLELGLQKDEAGVLKELSGSLRRVTQWLPKNDSEFELIDLTPDWRADAIHEIEGLAVTLARPPKPEELTIVDPKHAFDLDASGQIAALLGLTTARARAFANDVRS